MIGSDNLLFIISNNLMTIAKDSWSMDPKTKPKTKKQTTPTPLNRKKGS